MRTIKEIREERGVKVQAIADYLGVTRQTYSQYEANQSKLSIEQAKAVCEFLHCNPNEIFFGVEGQKN